jgi:hypothetical protein
MVFQVPHLKSTDEYTLATTPYNPFPYLDPSGQESANIYNDDTYGDVVTLPFPFCYYGTTYSSFTVGSNGLITFDVSNANCSNAYVIPATNPAIPGTGGGGQCSQFATYYPRASIMPAYSDLDPRLSASPGDRKIMWFVKGTAPCRKYIISFYHIGVFGNGCPTPANTFQIVLHESTGLIEYFLKIKLVIHRQIPVEVYLVFKTGIEIRLCLCREEILGIGQNLTPVIDLHLRVLHQIL